MEQTSIKKETSIDWLMAQLYKKGFIKEVDGNEPINLMNQAKEMEKQQIAELLAKLDSDIAKELTFKPKQERMYSEEEVNEFIKLKSKQNENNISIFCNVYIY